MEQQKQKKEWKTPELIVLVRSKPEEAVLVACKKGAVVIGPGAGIDNCKKDAQTQCTLLAIS